MRLFRRRCCASVPSHAETVSRVLFRPFRTFVISRRFTQGLRHWAGFLRRFAARTDLSTVILRAS